MTTEDATLQGMLGRALTGEGAHVEASKVLEGLDWELAGAQPTSVPHSIYQLVHHITYWDEWVVNWLDGEDPPIPEHASGSWVDTIGPPNREEWDRTVTRFATLSDELGQRTRDDLFSTRVAAGVTRTRLEMLQTIASHRSYHLGQVVFLRQMLGAWPPPSGGLTW